jgi:hypothetical protein
MDLEWEHSWILLVLLLPQQSEPDPKLNTATPIKSFTYLPSLKILTTLANLSSSCFVAITG